MVSVLKNCIDVDRIFPLYCNLLGVRKLTPRIQWGILCLNQKLPLGIIWDILLKLFSLKQMVR